MANLNKFFADVLKSIGAPPTPQNIRFLTNWQRHEGGWTNNSASFNPLNTTHGPGASINSVGVKAFGDYGTGVKMTAETVMNGRYPNIVAGLRSGNPYNVDMSGDLSTWVSGSPTKGLGYAQKVMGDRGVARAQTSTRGPRRSQVRNAPRLGGQSPNRAAAMALLDVARGYAETGEINNDQMARALGAVAKAGTVEPPVTRRGELPRSRSQVAGGIADKVLAAAHTQVGKPYVFGSGPSTDSFDCSDLVQWAWGQVGVKIPRTTYEQMKVLPKKSWKNLSPGDLIYKNDGGHVVMYVGGGKVIAAPYTGTVVQYQPLSRFQGGNYHVRSVV